MTVITRKAAPSHSFFIIDDSRSGTPPEPQFFAGTLSTSSMLYVTCLMFQDGKTEISLGPASEVPQEGMIAFDNYLETLNGMISITTVDGTIVAKQKVGTLNTRIRVWTNHPTEPDRIIVGWG